MALVPTGRTRIASVSLHAEQAFVPDAEIPAPVGEGTTPGFNQTWGQAWGCALQITHQGHPVTWSMDPTYEGPGYRIQWVLSITYRIHHGGAPVASPIEIDSAEGSAWQIVEELPGTVFGAATYVEGSISADLTASWTWVEYRDTVTGAVSEQATDGTISISGTGGFSFHVTAPGGVDTILNPLFTFSGSWETSVGVGASYEVGLDFNCVTTTGNSLTANCEGMQFTAGGVTLTAGSAELTGDGLTASVTKEDLGTLAQASVRNTPDWALELAVSNYDYETGDPLPVTTRHYTGSTLISISEAGYHRYPTSGYTSNLRASVSNGSSSASYNRNRPLLACEGAAGANLVRVDADWADAYGVFADSFQFAGRFSATNPGLNSQYGMFLGPDFDALAVRLDGSHRFGLLDDVTKLHVYSGSVTAAEGGIRIGQSGFAGSWVANRASGYIFRPVGYRFFRFEARAGRAGARFTLRIERKLDNVGGGRFATAYYDFTIDEADTWQQCELDLCFPSRISDPVHGNARYVLHPAAFQAFPEDTSVTFETPFGENTTYWLRDFYGVHLAGEGRVPALLIGPSCGGDPTADPIRQPPLGYDSCPGLTTNLFGQPRGPHLGRVVANGAMAFNLNGGAGTISADLDSLITHYHQAPGVDTGIHLVKGNSPWMESAEWESGWVIRRPLWSTLPLDTFVTLQGVKRGYANGYYGSGDVRAGSYGPTITFQGDKVWNGELLGLCHDTFRSLRDVELHLADDPTGVILETAASNGDGLIRLFHKYGVPLPFSNAPLGSTCASRKQYSGTLDNPTYTALGENLNGYWLVSPQLRQRDEQDRSNAFRAPDRWPILDRFAYWHDWETDPAPAAGVDLLQLQAGLLLRSGATEGTIRVERSGDAGVSWPLSVDLATDGGSTSVPTLTRNALDQVWCWYHDATGNTQVYLSKDWGTSWEPFASHAGLRYPRAARQWRRLLVAAHDRTTLRVYQSADDGLNLEEIPALALACPEQLVAFAVDRHDRAHLVYRTAGGALQLRRLELDDTWSDPVTVAEDGTQPALALGLQFGLILYWVGETLHAARTDEAYAEIAGTVAAPAGFARCYLGVLMDQAEMHLYAAGLDPDRERAIRYSGDAAATWGAPT